MAQTQITHKTEIINYFLCGPLPINPPVCGQGIGDHYFFFFLIYLFIFNSFTAFFFAFFPLCFLSLLMLPSHAAVMEKPLEKKAGRNYGPPGSKRLIYCIDDMNMPEVDAYGTVQPHTLIRQHMDYGHWYECYLQCILHV